MFRKRESFWTPTSLGKGHWEPTRCNHILCDKVFQVLVFRPRLSLEKQKNSKKNNNFSSHNFAKQIFFYLLISFLKLQDFHQEIWFRASFQPLYSRSPRPSYLEVRVLSSLRFSYLGVPHGASLCPYRSFSLAVHVLARSKGFSRGTSFSRGNI